MFDIQAVEESCSRFFEAFPLSSGSPESRRAWHCLMTLLRHYGVPEEERDWIGGLIVEAESAERVDGLRAGVRFARESMPGVA